MADQLKKVLLAGIGLALRTWDEVEALAKEMINKGKMSEAEGRKFLDDLQKKYEQTQKKLEVRVEKSVKDFLKKADVPTTSELKTLKKEVRELKKKIDGQIDKTS
jgi:polyhydroxyalkanoate synthesis regulator phasin